MDVVGYAHAGSVEQPTGSDLIKAERAIREWADTHDHQVLDVYRDAAPSTSSPAERPGLCAALAALRLPGPARPGRATPRPARRRPVPAGSCAPPRAAQRRQHLHCRGRAGAGRRRLRCQPDRAGPRPHPTGPGSDDDYERNLAPGPPPTEGPAGAARASHSSGRYAFGTRGQGTRKHPAAVPDPTEQQVIARILRLRADGLTYRQVAAALDDAGVPPRRASAWSVASIRLIVERARTST